MKNYVILASILMMVSGCTLAPHGNSEFVKQRNMDIGRSIEKVALTSAKVVAFDDHQDMYVYQTGKDCEFVYYVSKDSKNVLSWDYLSEPETCYIPIDFVEPW